MKRHRQQLTPRQRWVDHVRHVQAMDRAARRNVPVTLPTVHWLKRKEAQ